MGKKALPAKLWHPTVEDLLCRHRLFARLDGLRGGAAPFWVWGPAGSGKSSLVASWVVAGKIPCLWYSLDPDERDPEDFLRLLRAVAADPAPRRTASLRPDASGGCCPAPTPESHPAEILPRLIPGGVLVLDGVVPASSDGDPHAFIPGLVASLPPGVGCVLITRGLPFPLPGPSATGSPAGVGWPELALTRDEFEAVIRARRLSPQAKQRVRGCFHRLAGWPAGLEMLLFAAEAGTLDPEGHAPALPEEFQGYLAAQVLQELPDRLRPFFLASSLLGSLDETMARQFWKHPGAEELLRDLAARGCYLRSETGGRTVFHHYPMFREPLGRLLEEVFSAESLWMLRRAVAWTMADTGRYREAGSILAAMEDWDGLAELVRQRAGFLSGTGMFLSLRRMVGVLPGELVRSDPWLRYWAGLAETAVDPAAGQVILEAAYEQFMSHGDLRGAWMAWSSVVDALALRPGRGHLLERWFAEYDRLQGMSRVSPPPEVEARIVQGVFTILSLTGQDHPGLEDWTSRAEALFPDLPDPTRQAILGALLSLHHLDRGDLQRALAPMGTLDRLASSTRVSPPARLLLLALQVRVAVSSGSECPLTELVDRGLALAGTTACREAKIFLLAQGLEYAVWRGRWDQVRVLRDLAPPPLDAAEGWSPHAHRMSVQDLLVRGNRQAALAAQERALRVVALRSGPLEAARETLGLAELLLAEGKREEAATFLETGGRLAHRTRSRPLQAVHFLLRGLLRLKEGEETAALADLQEGLSLGRQGGGSTVPFLHPDHLARVCHLALEHDLETEYARELARRWREVWPAPPLHLPRWPWKARIHTLGRFAIRWEELPSGRPPEISPRPLALLKLLLALGGQDVPLERLADTLWPEVEGDNAHMSLNVTLHRLRRIMGVPEVLLLRDGLLSLNPRFCWVDFSALESLCLRAEEGCRSPAAPEELVRLAGRILNLYRGPFLAADPDDPAVLAARSRIETRVAETLARVARRLRLQGRLEAAERVLAGVATLGGKEDTQPP